MNNNFESSISDYAARTEFRLHERPLPFVGSKNEVPIGLDIGYSSTNVYSMFGQHIFPSFPIRVAEDFSMVADKTDIRYRDESGTWYIGNLARAAIEDGKIQAQSQTLFGRQRINSLEYLVLLRVGLFFGLIKKDLGHTYEIAKDIRLRINTGLPDQYLNRDRLALKERFAGHHHFEIKVGLKDWIKVSFDINEEDVHVISQPFGTLWALAANRNGELTNLDLLIKNVLIFDGGQHTIDTYFNRRGLKGISSTWENLSMMQIIRNVRKRVRGATKGQGDFLEYAFDKIITSDKPGKIRYGRRQEYDISKDIIECTEEIAKEAARELDTIYDNLNDVDILVCTGGTGKAFYPYFKKYYNYEGLEVLLAEKTDSDNEVENFSAVFANAVGFYNNLIANLNEEYGIESKDEAIAEFEKEVATTLAEEEV